MNVEQHYRECIRRYFDDPTEEGEIAKHAAMTECENILNEYFSCPRSRISEIYDSEYLRKYHPEVTPKAPHEDLEYKIYRILDDLRFNPVVEDLENALGDANLAEGDENMKAFCDKLAKKTPEISEAVVELVHEELFKIAKELREEM